MLRSYAQVVDLQLGQLMEEAELAAHANAWHPSVLLNHDMDAQLRYLLDVDQWISAADHPTTAERGSFPRPRSKVQSIRSSCISILVKRQIV